MLVVFVKSRSVTFFRGPQVLLLLSLISKLRTFLAR
jgi:hypothetical protein